MKLVMCYNQSDVCTYSFDRTIPIEYESEEALLCDFEDACMKANEENIGMFKFLGEDFLTRDFVDSLYEKGGDVKCMPDIYTLEDWFDTFKIPEGKKNE